MCKYSIRRFRLSVSSAGIARTTGAKTDFIPWDDVTELKLLPDQVVGVWHRVPGAAEPQRYSISTATCDISGKDFFSLLLEYQSRFGSTTDHEIKA